MVRRSYPKHAKHAKIEPRNARMSERPGNAGLNPSSSAWDFATSGTYVDAALPRIAAALFLVVAFAAILLPFVGMAWAPTESTTENRELAQPPQISHEGAFNVGFLADAGTYFEDHFAYRNQLVTANSKIMATLGTSSTDQVVVGDQDWLYYGGTLPDYLGQSSLSQRALQNIAHNLSLAQGYAKAHGAAFLFAVAPNKNSLYAQHMPGYYLKSPEQGNAQRLFPLLKSQGVRFVDLFGLFGAADGEWYLKRDSHWNNGGALMATQEAFRLLGRDAIDLDVSDGNPKADFVGDLESMLYPVGSRVESNLYYEGYCDDVNFAGDRWFYDEGSSVTDSVVRTHAAHGSGSLLMFRDSFGNALLPFWSSAYEHATFSKLVPYNLAALSQSKADTVVIERAERHIPDLAKSCPIMPNPKLAADDEWLAAENLDDASTTLTVEKDGPYWVVQGVVNPAVVPDDGELFVIVEAPGEKPALYDAFWVSIDQEGATATDFGYKVYMSANAFDLSEATLGVYVSTDASRMCLKQFADVTIEEE